VKEKVCNRYISLEFFDFPHDEKGRRKKNVIIIIMSQNLVLLRLVYKKRAFTKLTRDFRWNTHLPFS
jgi:hypothetical protein